MGLDINAVRFLIGARERGASFAKVLMIGRQDLNVYPRKMVQVLNQHGLAADAFLVEDARTRYADPFFAALGAREVHSLDASPFEGAGVVHDLNLPSPGNFRNLMTWFMTGHAGARVSFPARLQNCMEMVRPNGRLFIHTGTNNWCGHGFYQSVPRCSFALEPGQRVQGGTNDPAHGGTLRTLVSGQRPGGHPRAVELLTFCPVQLLIEARRTDIKPIFAQTPQQSDYTPRWEPSGVPASGTAPPVRRNPPVVYAPVRHPLARIFPNLMRLIHVLRQGMALYWNQSIRNRRNFRPIKKP